MKKILCGLMLVCAAAFAVVAVEKTVGTGASFKGPVGLQLYSLRNQFAKDVPGTLDLVKKMGFKYVETAGTYGKSAEDFKKMLDERGLVAIGGHFGFDRYEKDPEAVAKEAAALGLKFAGCAWIPHKAEFDDEECKHAADVFNKAGEALAKYGIKFYYHTHGYEFQPRGEGTLFDTLVTSTKPEFVTFQMDVTWVVHPGQDPAKLLKKYPNRWALMHIKDLKKGVPHNLSGGTDKENDVCVGTGQTDWPATMKAAAEVGVQWYFVEDESSVSVTQVPCSLGYLEKLEF
jgi:sugar phosphate isomerase/epimerase